MLRQIVVKLCPLFVQHCIISAYTQDYEMKFSTVTNFDTYDLKFKINSNIQKLVKRQALSPQILIPIDSVSQIILFSYISQI